MIEQLNNQLSPNRSLGDYQQFHRDLDVNKGFDPDLFFNYACFLEEVGEVAQELKQVRFRADKLAREGLSQQAALQEALVERRDSLSDELADLLAYIFKLANLTHIDLETAYLEKMRRNVNRQWPMDK